MIEKRRIEELDKRWRSCTRRSGSSARRWAASTPRENNQAIAKQIQILENRLDKARSGNEALANNKRLRENIDNLRRERLVADQIYKKLEKELAEKKKEMARIIRSRTRRTRRATRRRAMSSSRRRRTRSRRTERGGRARQMIEQDRKMRTGEEGAREAAAAGTAGHDGRAGGVAQEEGAPRQLGIAKDKASIHASMEKVQSYEEAFAKIQAATGISDIDELVTTFINAEDQNLALFNYVNELNGECEKLEEQIADIRGEIEKYKGQGLNTDNQRKKILKDLEERLARTEAKAEQYEKKYEAAMKTVNALKVGIASIFKKIGCDTPANLEMLGNEGVTESNMMQYLGIIEQRTNEILQLYAATQARERARRGRLGDDRGLVNPRPGPQAPAATTSPSSRRRRRTRHTTRKRISVRPPGRISNPAFPALAFVPLLTARVFDSPSCRTTRTRTGLILATSSRRRRCAGCTSGRTKRGRRRAERRPRAASDEHERSWNVQRRERPCL